VADLDQNRGAFGFGEGAMVAHVRAADPGARGIGAMHVADDAMVPCPAGRGIQLGRHAVPTLPVILAEYTCDMGRPSCDAGQA
jgi:hypothetical protein